MGNVRTEISEVVIVNTSGWVIITRTLGDIVAKTLEIVIAKPLKNVIVKSTGVLLPIAVGYTASPDRLSREFISCLQLFMICLVSYDFKTSVHLFKEDYPHHLMGKCH